MEVTLLEHDVALLLDSEAWLQEIDNKEAGEEIQAPLSLPPFVKGRTTILGAETGVGKTSFGLQAFVWAVNENENSVYFNLEMTPADLFERLSIQFGDDALAREWINTHSDNIYVSRPYIDDQEIEKILRTAEYGFAVLDHIHELPFDGHEDLGRKVRRIASLASATNTALLMLSQMKQRDEYSVGPPSKKDFSWTKAISEVAAQLYAIWLPDEDDQWTAELVCLKNRFGPRVSAMNLRFNPKTAAFERSY